MRVMSGACVSRARLQAADGAPIPTKHTSSFSNARAATTVIISFGVNTEGLRAFVDDVFGHPTSESLPVARDFVPRLVERVGAAVVPLRVRRIGAAGYHGNRRHRPRRKNHGIE